MLPIENDTIVAQAHKNWPNNPIFRDAVHVKNNFVCPSIPINSFVDCELFNVTNNNDNSSSNSILLSELIATTPYTIIAAGSRT